MADLYLIPILIGVMIVGFFVVKRIDGFLSENRTFLEQERLAGSQESRLFHGNTGKDGKPETGSETGNSIRWKDLLPADYPEACGLGWEEKRASGGFSGLEKVSSKAPGILAGETGGLRAESPDRKDRPNAPESPLEGRRICASVGEKARKVIFPAKPFRPGI
ncbi:MAG: hypothetical protein K5989_10295 [Lachnospiraceae bacterium]|nr:hypothetical protein [Lachnospiraceae bacterium]